MSDFKHLPLGDRNIGPDHPVYVIAEAGVNHNGDPRLAAELVDAAAEAGADAVKFQTFQPGRLASPKAGLADYQKASERNPAGSQQSLLQKLVLSPDIHADLMERARKKKIDFLSTPFDEDSARFLLKLDLPALKVGSGEATNLPFLRLLSSLGKPLILSTGMCDMEEVETAVGTIRGAGNPPLALFHCVSSYPSLPGDSNLSCIRNLQETFRIPVGWSDHTRGIEVSIAAVGAGAHLLEKHLTLDRTLPGVDQQASTEPREFTEMVQCVRSAWEALGDGRKRPVEQEREVARAARRSLHWSASLGSGERVRSEHLEALRPGTGMPPSALEELVGKTVRNGVTAGDMARPEDVKS